MIRTTLPPDRPGEGAVLEEIRVEVALPVVPEPVGVARQGRNRDPAPLQRRLGLGGVEVGRVVDVDEHRARDAEVGEDLVADALDGRQHREPASDLLRDEVEHPRVDPQHRLGRVGCLGEDVDHLARRQRIRVGEVEGLAVEPIDVGDVVHRLGDEVDRDDVDLPPLDADSREPARDRVPGSLQELEEVVRAVDLVHLAGLGVPDDDPRPVDPPRHLGLLADHGLRLVLGLEVGMVVDLLGLLEHVLGEGPLVEAGSGDRADHVEVLGVELLGELDRLPGALDVRDALALCVRGHVVDRREVEEVVDLALQLRDLIAAAQVLLGEVADHRDDPVVVRAPAVQELLEAAARSLAHEDVDRPLALEQLLDQVAADETGGTGDEVAHLTSSLGNLHREPVAGTARACPSRSPCRCPCRGHRRSDPWSPSPRPACPCQPHRRSCRCRPCP